MTASARVAERISSQASVVLTDGAAPEVRDRLQDLMTIIVPRQDPVAALGELLGVLFPVAETAERGV